MGGDRARTAAGEENLHVPFNRLIRSFLFCELVTVYVTFENLRVSSIRVACRVSCEHACRERRQSPVASRPPPVDYTLHDARHWEALLHKSLAQTLPQLSRRRIRRHFNVQRSTLGGLAPAVAR